ncbi:MAG: hypothetical protein ACXWQO_11405 [Bdellovibrionota bacterium]
MRYSCILLTTIFLMFPVETLFADNLQPPKLFPAEMHYLHPLFRTAEECKKAQHGGMWFNCNQTITFYPNGTASLMFTDIMNSATYELNGREVMVKSNSAGDAPTTMKFTMDSTGRNLVSEGPVVWELEQSRSCVQ